MPTSTPSIETPSNATLDCFTGAIVVREGAAAVGSTFLEPASSLPPAVPSSMPGSMPGSMPSSVPISMSGPTSVSELPPYFVPKPPFRSPAGAFVVRPHPAVERARRADDQRRGRRREPVAARSAVPWKVLGAFATGAAFAAFAADLADGGALVVAACAAIIAGGATLEVAMTERRQQAPCRKVRRAA